MRIGYLTYGLDRCPTGIGRYAVELLAALARLPGRHELVLLVTERSDPHGLWARFEHHHLVGCRLLPSLLSIGHMQVGQTAHRYQLDLIHDPNGIAPFLWPGLKIPTLVTIHDAFAFVYPQTQARLDVWRFRNLLPPVARHVAQVITDSAHSRQDLVRFLGLDPGRVCAIALAADARFHPVADAPERQAILQRYGVASPYLLYTGGINPRKNIPRLLEAFSAVRAAHQPYASLSSGSPSGAAPRCSPRSTALGSGQPSSSPAMSQIAIYPRSTAPPHASSSLHSTKASGCHPSKRWPAARR